MKYHWWTLVYVFDVTATEGREFKRRESGSGNIIWGA